MVDPGGRGRSRCRASVAFVAFIATACSWLPSELNLSPIYRHRLDEAGDVLELDVLWPLFHYEVTASGGTDFRVRPLYRYLTESAEENVVAREATEHQFLWPLGRVRYDGEQTIVRLFPLFSHTSRPNQDGQREADWYFAFPFVWGGSREDGDENYFGVFPIYLDIPEFLVYDRFRMILWPLYVGLEKSGRISHLFAWPLTGYGYGPDGSYWHRVLPFYSVVVDPRWERYSVLWPFVSWGREGLDSDDPISRLLFWPLFGYQHSETVVGWTFLWPLFQMIRKQGLLFRLDFLWPFFRYTEDRAGVMRAVGSRVSGGLEGAFRQWWFWPFVSRTESEVHDARSFLWPLIWLREYLDPEGKTTQTWFLPLFWHNRREFKAGPVEDYVKVWPLYHRWIREGADGAAESGNWRFPSVWPWRGNNARGMQEMYGFLWTIAEGRRRGREDDSMGLLANLFTTRQRGARRQTSVPFLFNYDGDADGGTLRLLQLIPIPWWGTGSSSPAATTPATRGDDR